MHRLIVTSATYRQASSATPALLARDPENRLLARGPRFRLPAEVVRDNALAIAGLLVETDRRPVDQAVSAGRALGRAGRRRGRGALRAGQGRRTSIAAASTSTASGRSRTRVMATFDAPSREVCQVKRPRTNTPLQALELLNDVTYVEAARHLAQLMHRTRGAATPEERITYAFRRALARDADARPSSTSCGAGWNDTWPPIAPIRRPRAQLDPARREPRRSEDRPGRCWRPTRRRPASS